MLKRRRKTVAAQCDLAAIAALFRHLHADEDRSGSTLAFLPRSFGQHIAVAHDQAFSFVYPHLLKTLRDEGREVSFFSPLKDEAPDEGADSIYLPGGYPELYCAGLAAAENFKSAMVKASEGGTVIYGECGGYMVLGQAITDREGQVHDMLGLLELQTSFARTQTPFGLSQDKGPCGKVCRFEVCRA